MKIEIENLISSTKMEGRNGARIALTRRRTTTTRTVQKHQRRVLSWRLARLSPFTSVKHDDSPRAGSLLEPLPERETGNDEEGTASNERWTTCGCFWGKNSASWSEHVRYQRDERTIDRPSMHGTVTIRFHRRAATNRIRIREISMESIRGCSQVFLS